MIVVFGTIGGGTSAVASVLHHLGVFMGAEFGASYRELQQNWEDAGDRPIVPQGRQCKERAASDGTSFVPGEAPKSGLMVIAAQPAPLEHRPGVKHPLLCAAIDILDDGAWCPIVPVVVERPFAKVVSILERLEWWPMNRTGADRRTMSSPRGTCLWRIGRRSTSTSRNSGPVG